MHKDIHDRISVVKTERARSSLDFFTKNAEKFSEKQALVAEKAQYVANLHELVKATKLPDHATAIEVGPGEGEFICELATQFRETIALDNSEAMLSIAQNRAQQLGLENIRFILGEPATCTPEDSIQGDLVICNMVLHHIASPADALKDIAQLLNPQGYLLLAELCHHNQDWVRESCGDLWLGFEPEELTHWANECRSNDKPKPVFSVAQWLPDSTPFISKNNSLTEHPYDKLLSFYLRIGLGRTSRQNGGPDFRRRSRRNAQR